MKKLSIAIVLVLVLFGTAHGLRVSQFPAGVKTPFVCSVDTLTSTAIQTAWDAFTQGGVVQLQPGQTYVGNLTLSESTYPLTLDGQGAKLTGNLIINKSKDVIVKNLYVDGYGEINGCWRCKVENIVFEEGGGFFAGRTKSADHYLLITDSSDTSGAGFGTFWNSFDRVAAHGLILLPGGRGTTSDNGINTNTFSKCRFQGALTDGTGGLTDTDNASIRVGVIGTDTEVSSQANICTGCDISDSHYAVRNGNTQWPFVVDGGSYIEQYEVLNTGPVIFFDTYIYSSLPEVGDGDLILDYDQRFSTLNRGTTGVDLFPSLDIYGNPWFQKLELIDVGDSQQWLPQNVSAGWEEICGDEDREGSSISMVEDLESGSPYGMVLKAVGGATENCSVRFKADMSYMDAPGHLSAVVLMKGQFEQSLIGYVALGEDSTYSTNVLHGTRSDTSYELFAGAESSGHARIAGERPYVEIKVGAGQTVYIANVVLSKGTVTTAQSVSYPYRREAFSSTGPPTATNGGGIWLSGDVIWNSGHTNYWGGSHGFAGMPLGWYVEESGTFGDTDPIIRAFGQLGITNNEHVTSGSPTYRSVQRGEVMFTHESGDATAANTDFWMAFDDNESDWKRINTGYTLQVGMKESDPADGATYYLGGCFGSIALTDGSRCRIYIPKGGAVKTIYTFVNNANLGDAATSSLYFRLNSSTDTELSAAVDHATEDVLIEKTGLSIAVARGDYFTLKWVCPTWATTNPTNVRINATIYIE
jgi:hypothetical protein